MKEVTITRALTELKTIDDRIDKAMGSLTPIAVVIGTSSDINGQSRDEWEKSQIGYYDTVISLIERKRKIKKKIAESNQITNVTIGEKTMTVQEAIFMKDTIKELASLKSILSEQHQKHIQLQQSAEMRLQENFNKFLSGLTATDTPKDNIDAMTESFKESNKVTLVDPLSTVSKIEKLNEQIQQFIVDVDAILSESNSTTEILLD